MTSHKRIYKIDQPHSQVDSSSYISWQPSSGRLLAATYDDHSVALYDRQGTKLETIALRGVCTGFGWDADGDLLAAISSNSQHIIVWDSTTQKKLHIETGLRDPLTLIVWAKHAPILAVGTARGNITIYNHTSAKRYPILGKHNKRVSSGAWSAEGLLALGSEDRTLSISNNEGDSLRIISLRAEPSDIQFSEMKLDERLGGENTVSLLVGRKTLFLYNLPDPDNPVELAFQQKYGHVVTYKWFGDGYILLGFSAGYFVAISTHIKEVGQELFQVKNHRESLTDIAVCMKTGKVASCGDNMIKVHDINNLKETSSVLSLDDELSVDHIAWSEDGQLLAASCRSGAICIFLSNLPMISSVSSQYIIILSTLTELSIFFYLQDFKGKVPEKPLTLKLNIEPNFVAVGIYHCACGMNNRAWFYDLTNLNQTDEPVFLKDREYLGTVSSLKLNAEYASALYEGKIQLHLIESGDGMDEKREMKLFPDHGSLGLNITSHQLTVDFLIYSTDMGHIHYFYLEEWKFVSDFQHEVGIKAVYSDTIGTKLVFIDERSEGYLYTPISDQVLKIPQCPSQCCGALWDHQIRVCEPNVFVLYDDKNLYTYIYIRESVYGSYVQHVGQTKIPAQQVPLVLCDGHVLMETSTGSLVSLFLSTHEMMSTSVQDSQLERLERVLGKQLALHRFTEAWKTCQVLNIKECWIMLGETALKNLEIKLAIRVYRHMGDVGMVWALQSIENVEELHLLCGHIALILKDFEKAQEWYLRSQNPIAALDMCRDLLHWDQAMHLATKLAPEQVPFIACEYAQQLEFLGNHSEALMHYEQGFLHEDANYGDTSAIEHHNFLCNAGIARSAIRCGDFLRGITLATEIAETNSDSCRKLLKECGEILEGMKMLHEAAVLYEKGKYFNKAASMYIKIKNYQKLSDMLQHVSSSSILSQVAKIAEADGKLPEALEHYKRALDYENAIRICLDGLGNPEQAITLYKDSKSSDGARRIARYYQQHNDPRKAIQFLVSSNCDNEAFKLALQNGLMDLYGEILTSSHDHESRIEDFHSLAIYFEKENNFYLSGKYFFLSRDYEKALRHTMRSILNSDENPQAIEQAIELAGVVNDEDYVNRLIDYLLGEVDGMPKDPNYLFRLYVSRKQFKEAAKTAVIISNSEQTNGNYRAAHDIMFKMYKHFEENDLKVPSEVEENLILLHSYILVKLHVKLAQHMNAARLLIRISNNISKFPAHIVPILTSTVIECLRAGLKSEAYNFAVILLRPEHRNLIDPKYSRKVEAVVRKTGRKSSTAEPVEQSSPCPFCSNLVPDYTLTCSHCMNQLPFCIATGRHISKDNSVTCEGCGFPAIFSELMLLAQSKELCPMCYVKIKVEESHEIYDEDKVTPVSLKNQLENSVNDVL